MLSYQATTSHAAANDALIKQEPISPSDVQAPVWFDYDSLGADVHEPFFDLVSERAIESVATPTYSPSSFRPHALAMEQATEDAFILHSLLCVEETKTVMGWESPSAVSHFDDRLLQSPATATKTLCSNHGCRQHATNGDRCRKHTGGRRCAVPGCTKNTQSNGRCIRHGGGRRCDVEGCTRGAQARGKCKAHGGGVRCKAPGCTRSSQGSGLCRTHGGGKLCDYPGCKKGTQRHGKCSTHGGARRCHVEGCTKVDRGGGLCGRHKAKSIQSGSMDDDDCATV